VQIDHGNSVRQQDGPELIMALKLRPTGLGHGVYKDVPDHGIFCGEWCIGRTLPPHGNRPPTIANFSHSPPASDVAGETHDGDVPSSLAYQPHFLTEAFILLPQYVCESGPADVVNVISFIGWARSAYYEGLRLSRIKGAPDRRLKPVEAG
jgi:hypothetical protein